VRPDGHRVDWLTYGSGHVHGLVLDGEERVQFERDDLHREVRRVLPSKVVQQTMYDPVGRLQKQTVQRENAPAPLSARLYRYDAAGQLMHIEDSRKGLTDYRYDPVGRLLEAVGPGGAERFAFDPASNLIDAGDPEQARSRAAVSPVSPGRVESTLPPQVPKVLGNLLKQYAGTHFEYDAQGNLLEKRSAGRVQRFEWDGFNRLSRVSAGAGEARYFYDPFGRRVAKEAGGALTLFGWDGDTLAYESDGEQSTHYVYEAGSFVPLAQFVSKPVRGIETPVWSEASRYTPEDDPLLRVPTRSGEAHAYYYHCDQIGTPQLLTDDLGDVVWEASYKAWGEAREVIERVSKATGQVVRNRIRFQGQQVDEAGVVYNRHRYYDPTVGRYISKDPIGLRGGLNGYQYAPNPVQWVDQLGLSKCKCPCIGNPVGSVETPYGPALQGESQSARDAIKRVQGGATLYRTGTMGKSQAAEAQFWSLEHPSSPGYAQRYGIPQENIENANFIETGVLHADTPFVTRAAPAVGDNLGGGIEVVTPPHGVRLKSFCTR
jgi:RHS repeat-associated protein